MKLLIGCVAMLVASTGQINAGVIDFEGKSGLASGIGSFLDVDDYRFTITGGGSAEVITGQSNIVEANTTKLFATNYTVITMSRIDGGAFSLQSVDIGGSWTNPSLFSRWADHVDVVSTEGTETADLSTFDPTYRTVTTNFNNVTSVLFDPTRHPGGSGSDYEFVIDNIVVGEPSSDAQDVPEPTSLAIFGLGALGLAGGAIRRRKKQQA